MDGNGLASFAAMEVGCLLGCFSFIVAIPMVVLGVLVGYFIWGR